MAGSTCLHEHVPSNIGHQTLSYFIVICLQVLKMESLILKTLGFYICVPTTVDFLERFLKATECSDSESLKVEALAKVR